MFKLKKIIKTSCNVSNSLSSYSRIIKRRKLFAYLFTLFLLLVYLLTASLPLFIFPSNIYCDDWLKIADIQNEQVWVDTSRWETREVLVRDGYYKNVIKNRWVDTSYTVAQGHWAIGHYDVWVQQTSLVPYTAYRYVDTSHLKTTARFVEVIKPVNFSVIFGTDSYGWSVYAFAAAPKGMKQVTYNGEKYLVDIWVIDYRPSRGGHIYAVKYNFKYKFVMELRYYTEWVQSGHWEPYTAYRSVDTSYWDTRTGRYWVDTSYGVQSGYWEQYSAREWVDTSYYEYKNVWVADGYYTKPLRGKITVEKSPKYIFTRWHRNEGGKECGMDLKVLWELDNTEIMPGQEPKKIARAHIYQVTSRYGDKGEYETLVFDGAVSPAEAGYIEVFSTFDFAGDEKSRLHIQLFSEDGQGIHVYFSNPVNGFRSINTDYGGTAKDADRWLGGNYYGQVSF